MLELNGEGKEDAFKTQVIVEEKYLTFISR